MDFTYFNAVYTVENALSKVKDGKGMKRVEKFLKQGTCPDCHGSRLSEAARWPKLRGIPLDEACRMTLAELADWVAAVLDSLPEEMQPMAHSICESFQVRSADYIIDMGPGGGETGGRIVATGMPEDVRCTAESVTGRFI